MPEPSYPVPDRPERIIACVVFAAALAFHAWGVSVGWHNAGLPGNEFRQTQTAITAFFVQRDHDFSLAYPTPVLGKPWSVPFEFPLYQWIVVVVSDVTGLSITHAGRAVSIACFYLALPAIWLLLGRLGVAGTRRLVVLGAILTCPLYVFYARAFLIETMALMFSLWFLYAYVAAVEGRSWIWLAVANVAGAGAGLVKVTTFMLYLMPAAAWSLAWLWRARPQAGTETAGWSRLVRTAGWIAGATAVPFAATYGWIRFADAVKALNPSSRNLVSAAMHSYNFGTWETRFSPGLWSLHGQIIINDIISVTVLVMAATLGLLFAGRWRGRIAWCLGLFVAVQALFPVLYAWHEYYFVANAVLLLTAVGLVLCGLLDSAVPRAVTWILVGGLLVGQAAHYLQRDYPLQQFPGVGPSDLTRALRLVTEPDDVLVVAGEDWASMTPFYAQRRALMIRRDMEGDGDYLRDAFGRLKGERVTALVLDGVQRENQPLRELAAEYFGIDPQPVFAFGNVTVWLARHQRTAAIRLLQDAQFLYVVLLEQVATADGDPFLRREVALSELFPRQRQMFVAMSPQPARFYTTFGWNVGDVGGQPFVSAHPDSRLWFSVPPGPRTIAAAYYLMPGSYAGLPPQEATDGVEFAIYELRADGTRRQVFDRLLDPAKNPDDRGVQQLTLGVRLEPGAELLFETGPGARKQYHRDWAAWGPITIK